jgi:hypothetical protein
VRVANLRAEALFFSYAELRFLIFFGYFLASRQESDKNSENGRQLKLEIPMAVGA